MSYTIKQRFISQNRSRTPLKAIGTVVHETATPGASDEAEFNYFNSANRGASAHAFVDYDSITQTIPWNERAGHAGPTANRNYIGIELCHYDDAARFDEVWKRAVWLFAWVHINVIKQTTINKNTLMSHAEVTSKWRESTHTDPVAYFKKFGRTVDMFRQEVQKEINSQLNIKSGGTDSSNNNEQTEDQGKVAGASTETLSIQKSLNRLRIRDNEGKALVEDGVIGTRTKEAVKRLQSISGLSQDGIPGAQTKAAINSILTKPTLKVGSKGTVVRYLQFRVGTNIDGVFGSNTKAKVMTYQKNNGLSADGIVGPKTWEKLIG